MIQRRTPIQRSTPLARSTKRIPRRRASIRRGPAGIPADEWRNPEYRRFLVEEGKCVACAKQDTFRLGNLRGWLICDPAHTQNNGLSSKGPDSSCSPLCRVHHDQYDGHARLPDGNYGHEAFEAYYQIDMKQESGAWWAAWLIYRETKA